MKEVWVSNCRIFDNAELLIEVPFLAGKMGAVLFSILRMML